MVNDATDREASAPDLRNDLLHLVLAKSNPEERETIELVCSLFFSLMAETDPVDPSALARDAERSMDRWLAKRIRLLTET